MTRTLFVLMGVSPFQGLGFIVFITKPRYTLFAFYTGLLTPPMAVQANHTLDRFCFLIHGLLLMLCRRAEIGSGAYMHSGMRGGPHVGALRRCSFAITGNYPNRGSRASPESPPA